MALTVLLATSALVLLFDNGRDGGGILAPDGRPFEVAGTTESSGSPETTSVYDHTRGGLGDPVPQKAPMDAVPPTIGPDRTPATATTGDPLVFNVSVSDPDGVSNVSIEHWRGASTTHTTELMARVSGDASSGTYSLSITMPPDSTADLWYTFEAYDTVGNSNVTSKKRVTVSDNDKPTIEDLSPTTATTGDTYTFKLKTTDNIGLNPLMVYIVYGFGYLSEFWAMAPFDITGAGNGTYIFDIVIPYASIESLVYLFNVSDSSGNQNMSGQVSVTVTDNDAPIFKADASDAAATTGDPFRFSIDISDNIDVTSHRVAYWFGAGPEMNLSMVGVGLIGTNGTYELTITIPSDSLDPLHYRFWANDKAGNLNSTPLMTRAVVDNDPPEYLDDLSVKTSDTNFRLEVSVNDNIGMAGVYTEFWFGAGAPSNLSMNPVVTTGIGNGTYSLDVVLPTCSTEPFHYLFAVVDTSGNWNVTPEVVLDLSDDEPPRFGADHTDARVVKRMGMNFSIEVFDNIGVGAVHVEYWFGVGARKNVTMAGPGGAGGTYMVTVTVLRHPDGELRYIFRARDLVGTWNSTPEAGRTPINLPPVFDELVVWTIMEGEQGTYDLTGKVSDPNDLTGSLVLSCLDPHVTVEGLLLTALYPTYMPDQRVEVSLTDGEDTTYANITVRVVNVDDAPVITSSPPLTATAGVPYTYQVVWTDEDVGDTFTFGLAAKPAGLTVGPNGLVTWTPTMDQLGPNVVDLTLSDGNITVHQAWTVTVTAPPVNQPPRFTSTPPLAVTVGQYYQWNAIAEDPEGDALTFSLKEGPTAANMDAATGVLSWDPPANRRGGYEDVNFTVQVSDSTNDVTLTFTVRATYPANHPPEILGTPPSQRIKAAVTINLTQYKSDADDPKPSLVWTTEGGNTDLFTVRIVGDSLTIEPKKGAKGISNLTLVLTDPWGAQDRYTIAVNVEGSGGGGGAGAGKSYTTWLLLLVVLVVVVAIAYLLIRGKKAPKQVVPKEEGQEGGAPEQGAPEGEAPEKGAPE